MDLQFHWSDNAVQVHNMDLNEMLDGASGSS